MVVVWVVVGGFDRSLLALHVNRAELGSLSPLPHSHTNLGLPIIYPWETFKAHFAHRHIKIYFFSHRNLDSLAAFALVKVLKWLNQSMRNDKILNNDHKKEKCNSSRHDKKNQPWKIICYCPRKAPICTEQGCSDFCSGTPDGESSALLE